MKMLKKNEKIKENRSSLARRLNLTDSEYLFFPKYFEIETVRACNARCKMCPVWKYPEDYGKMEQELFNKISAEISKYFDLVNSVCLSRNGEPLLDKTIVEKIKTLKNYGIKDVTLSTNASLLNKNLSIQLIESRLDDIRFSIDGYTKDTFEFIREGLNFEKVVKNCIQFIQLRNERGQKPRIRIRMVLQDENRNEESEWKDFWLSKTSKNDLVYSKTINTWGNQLNNSPIKKTIETSTDVPCISPFSTMVILYDGKVPLCGVDYNNQFNFGNLYKSTIAEIWHSKNLEKIRTLHLSGKKDKISLCVGCNIWDLEQKKLYSQK